MRTFGIISFILGLLILLIGLFVDIAYLTNYFPYVRPLILGGLFLIIISFLFNFSTIRQILSQRTARYGLNMAIYILLMAGLLIVINFFCIQHNRRLDLTGEKLYSLSPLTLKVLSRLKSQLLSSLSPD
jgi:hypothetical protein